MHFTVLVDGRPVEGVLEVLDKTETEGLVEVRIEERIYRIEFVRTEPSLYWLKWGDRSIEAAVFSSEVSIGFRRFAVEVLDARTAALRRVRGAETTAAGGGRREVRAPMPGRIVRTLVAPGDTVEMGRALVVIEAMKMQNEIRAPHRGTVKSIAASDGARVASGDLLVTLE